MRKGCVIALWTVGVVLAGAVAVSAQTSAAAGGPAKAKPVLKSYAPGKTPWGDPDLQGIYTNKDENGIPLERPSQFDGKRPEDVEESEFAEVVRERQERATANAAGIGGAET